MLEQGHSAGGPAASSSQSQASAWLHRFAILVMTITFLLIIVGGNVTTKGAGMAVPDWPRSFGSFNPDGWTTDMNGTVPGVRAEHGHRLLGATLGFLVIILTAWLWKVESRPWVRWLGYAALVAVIIQGVMGGLRVTRISVPLAIVHGCFAQAFFCLTVVIAAATSPWWRAAQLAPGDAPERTLRMWTVLLAAAVYGQLVIGAIYRHLGTGVMWHIGGALVVGIMLMQVSQQVFRRPLEQDRGLSKLTLVLFGMLALQVVLGVMTLVSVLPLHGAEGPRSPGTVAATYLPTAHVALGAIILGWTVYLAMRARLAPALGAPVAGTQEGLQGALA